MARTIASFILTLSALGEAVASQIPADLVYGKPAPGVCWQATYKSLEVPYSNGGAFTNGSSYQVWSIYVSGRYGFGYFDASLRDYLLVFQKADEQTKDYIERWQYCGPKHGNVEGEVKAFIEAEVRAGGGAIFEGDAGAGGQAVGFAWYESSTHPRILVVADDSAVATKDGWLQPITLTLDGSGASMRSTIHVPGLPRRDSDDATAPEGGCADTWEFRSRCGIAVDYRVQLGFTTSGVPHYSSWGRVEASIQGVVTLSEQDSCP